ncbi:hypothetical protein B0T25DRAFT_191374 [Lasiosphaeria hispida]|uniref:Uncharacterized protein n=1 Tax=Lasiosphaeria hispida TaxID=260671 RepID=A0AAJ0HHU9_9PEZI|nr:hypothetical protein B0T25DRAFT_191374 [Lasiosphaeria hispida]
MPGAPAGGLLNLEGSWQGNLCPTHRVAHHLAVRCAYGGWRLEGCRLANGQLSAGHHAGNGSTPSLVSIGVPTNDTLFHIHRVHGIYCSQGTTFCALPLLSIPLGTLSGEARAARKQQAQSRPQHNSTQGRRVAGQRRGRWGENDSRLQASWTLPERDRGQLCHRRARRAVLTRDDRPPCIGATECWTYSGRRAVAMSHSAHQAERREAGDGGEQSEVSRRRNKKEEITRMFPLLSKAPGRRCSHCSQWLQLNRPVEMLARLADCSRGRLALDRIETLCLRPETCALERSNQSTGRELLHDKGPAGRQFYDACRPDTCSLH